MRNKFDEFVKRRHSGLSGIGCFCIALEKKDSGQAGMTVSRYYRTIYEYIKFAEGKTLDASFVTRHAS